ncbi:hypothetical protein FG386_001252 [Cryptosporidium ryanae]|uniref:uncharacterized protein n=1 Tax=Cryptosporidium ryanae TaxID=515981 RepID=UPI003519DB81|nr:hypothetical protein FG386_001252 [Cryptosporidium ryanae]
MPRKGSDVSGMGTELLNILGLSKYKNNDDSDTADNKSSKSSKSTKSHSKFKKLKKLSKESKKSKPAKEESTSNNIEIEIGLNNDNFETVQASEKSAVSSLIDVHSNFERQLAEFDNSITSIKKNVDDTESQLEKLYISLDKLEKFVELCNVENADVIKGLHKLMDVHKGAALLSTFSEDPTFKKNYEYNVNDESNSEIIERKLQNIGIVKSMNIENCEIPNENENNGDNKNDDENKNIEHEKGDKVSIKSSDNIIINNLYNNSENSHSKSSELEQKTSSSPSNTTNNSPSNNNKEGKVSKTERFKEKLDNLRIRKGKKKQSKNKHENSNKNKTNEIPNSDLNSLPTDN